MPTNINSLDYLLRNILLSHAVVREFPENNSNRTLIKIHLIPFPGSIPGRATSPGMLGPRKIKYKRNNHVSHLPPYKKITETSVEENSEKNFASSDCSICIEEFKKGEYFRKLPICSHIFHKKCIDKWFTMDKHMSCPICRAGHTLEKWNEHISV